jgi:hypothetical protein
MEPTAEPHLRRHSRKLVENIHAFLLRDDHSDSDLSRKERGVR